MINKRVLVIYHRVDGDGLTSCMIARSHYLDLGANVDIFGFNYNDKVPDIQSYLRVYDEICMVDISFAPEIMKTLCDSGRALWIDHHVTAINDSQTYGYSDMPGLRFIGQAACELAWTFFNPDKQMPKFVYYSGVYDTWRKPEADWDNEILPLQYANRMELSIKPELWISAWDDLIRDDSTVDNLISSGRAILKYMKQTWEGWVKGYSFPVKVAGQYSAICMITPMFGSSCFESVMDSFDIYITTNRKQDQDGEVYYSLSMYKEPDRLPEFSCGEYLKSKFPGAGGHASAAGGKITLDDFIRLITEGEI